MQGIVGPGVRVTWMGHLSPEPCRTGPAHGSGSDPSPHMEDPNVKRWLAEAKPVLRRVTSAEMRFSVAIKLNPITTLAAADELEAATMEAMVWMMDNHCSEIRLDSRVALMLNTCAEVARTAKQVITHPSGDLGTVVDRLVDLLANIDFRSHSLETW